MISPCYRGINKTHTSLSLHCVTDERKTRHDPLLDLFMFYEDFGIFVVSVRCRVSRSHSFAFVSGPVPGTAGDRERGVSVSATLGLE